MTICLFTLINVTETEMYMRTTFLLACHAVNELRTPWPSQQLFLMLLGRWSIDLMVVEVILIEPIK